MRYHALRMWFVPEYTKTALAVNDALEIIYPASGNLTAAVRYVASNSGELRAINDSVRVPCVCLLCARFATLLLCYCSQWI